MKIIGFTGEPGSGKTRLMEVTLGKLSAFTQIQDWGNLKFTMVQGTKVLILGYYTKNQPFGGTDRLPMNVQPTAELLLKTLSQAPAYADWTVLFEGDRLMNGKFVEFCKQLSGVQAQFFAIATSQKKLEERRQARKSDQNATWLKGRKSKVDNLIQKEGLPVYFHGDQADSEAIADYLVALVSGQPESVVSEKLLHIRQRPERQPELELKPITHHADNPAAFKDYAPVPDALPSIAPVGTMFDSGLISGAGTLFEAPAAGPLPLGEAAKIPDEKWDEAAPWGRGKHPLTAADVALHGPIDLLAGTPEALELLRRRDEALARTQQPLPAPAATTLLEPTERPLPAQPAPAVVKAPAPAPAAVLEPPTVIPDPVADEEEELLVHKQSPLPPAETWASFADFCKYVQLAGGATPHLTMVEHAASGKPLMERLWMGGCYAATYNYAAAELIWKNWWRTRVLEAGIENFEPWLRENWSWIPLRKERKAVRSPAKLADCLVSYANWLSDWEKKDWTAGWPTMKQEDAAFYAHAMYEKAWVDFQQVRFMGRYITIRFLEYARRTAGCAIGMPDIRPKDGKFPRKALALLFPAHAAALNGDDSEANLKLANQAASATMGALLENYGVKVDYYTLQSLLCEWKQEILGKKQYPGRSIDSELVYWKKVYGPTSPWSQAGFLSDFYRVRKEAFPEWALGELQGWPGNREELGMVLTEHGYTWTDSTMDYKATLRGGRWADPVRKVAA